MHVDICTCFKQGESDHCGNSREAQDDAHEGKDMHRNDASVGSGHEFLYVFFLFGVFFVVLYE